MRNEAEIDVEEQPTDPRREGILSRLSVVAAELVDVDRRHRELMDERLALYQEGQGLPEKLTQAEMARAAGVTDIAVTLTLRAARMKAEGKKDPPRRKKTIGKKTAAKRA